MRSKRNVLGGCRPRGNQHQRECITAIVHVREFADASGIVSHSFVVAHLNRSLSSV